LDWVIHKFNTDYQLIKASVLGQVQNNSPKIQKFKNSKIQKFKNSKIQKFKNSKIQKFKEYFLQVELACPHKQDSEAYL